MQHKTMNPMVILEKKISKTDAIRVRIKSENYFSITALMGDKRRRYDDPIVILGEKYNCYAGGCLHSEVAEHFPELQRFIPLHLSLINGEPMYAFEHAKHWAKEKNAKVLAQHLRITLKEAEAICEASEKEYMIKKTIKKMKPVWKKQAEEFLSFINEHGTQTNH